MNLFNQVVIPQLVNTQVAERMHQYGTKKLTDTELLALFLGGSPKAMVTAARVMVKYQTLLSLTTASCKEFCANDGLTKQKYDLLHASIDIARRSREQNLIRGDSLTSSKLVFEYLQQELAGEKSEVFAVMHLDNKHRLLAFDKMYFGTIAGATIYKRDIVRACIHHNSAAVILSHNHPSGQSNPSELDISITQQIIEALAIIDVNVLDHVVVAGDEWNSLAELGYC